jgi:hypothetical protein
LRLALASNFHSLYFPNRVRTIGTFGTKNKLSVKNTVKKKKIKKLKIGTFGTKNKFP